MKKQLNLIATNYLKNLLPTRRKKRQEILLTSFLDLTKQILESTSYTTKQKEIHLFYILNLLVNDIQTSTVEKVLIDSSFNLYHLEQGLPNTNFCPHCMAKTFKLIKKEHVIPVNLKTYPIISPPWNKKRLLSNFQTIGTDVNNPFVHDTNNHFSVNYLYPLGIFFNENGRHSVSTGIIKKEGTIYTTQKIDLSNAYKHYHFNGTFFIHKKCNYPISESFHYKMGIIYEIGRLLLANHITFY